MSKERNKELNIENNNSQEDEKPFMGIMEKIYLIQKEAPQLIKDAVNPFHKSNYVTLGEVLRCVKPLLTKHKLICFSTCKIETINNTLVNTITTCILDLETSESIDSTFQIFNTGDPQKVGSQITYYRRYGIIALLELEVIDNDGEDSTKEWLNINTPEYNAVVEGIKNKKIKSVQDVRREYMVNKIVENALNKEFNNLVATPIKPASSSTPSVSSVSSTSNVVKLNSPIYLQITNAIKEKKIISLKQLIDKGYKLEENVISELNKLFN